MLFGTYNIHYGVGADGKYDVARIADAVAEADIVCLQETVRGWPQNGYADQTAEIGKRLNRYFRFHGPMEADSSSVDADGRITNRRRSFGNAIVSRWPILWSRGIMLPKVRLANTFDLQRGFVEAVVAAPSGPLRIYSTHLSHVGAQQRLPQVAALMNAVNRAPLNGGTWDAAAGETFMFQEPAPPVPASAIVAGDFNFTPAHLEYPLVCGTPSTYGRLATAEHLSDAWSAAGNSEEGVDSFPREGRIDHVFVTHDLAPKVRKAWIGYGIDASDHWPVFIEFDL
ncbi:MAG: endonuclease/exonuclease/phosphatase family protein [Reyranella sp.]|nr:endonuclease/exonuclease/phosphatase family protein [Reyranella sp.]